MDVVMLGPRGGAEDDLRNTGPGGLDDRDCNGEVTGVEAR